MPKTSTGALASEISRTTDAVVGGRCDDDFMKRLVLALAALLIVTPVTPVAASPGRHGGSQEGRSSCVTKHEERKLTGMTRAEVGDLLGWDGYAADLFTGARVYRACGWSWQQGQVTVRYGKAGRVWFPSRMVSPQGALVPPSESLA